MVEMGWSWLCCPLGRGGMEFRGVLSTAIANEEGKQQEGVEVGDRFMRTRW